MKKKNDKNFKKHTFSLKFEFHTLSLDYSFPCVYIHLILSHCHQSNANFPPAADNRTKRRRQQIGRRDFKEFSQTGNQTNHKRVQISPQMQVAALQYLRTCMYFYLLMRMIRVDRGNIYIFIYYCNI